MTAEIKKVKKPARAAKVAKPKAVKKTVKGKREVAAALKEAQKGPAAVQERAPEAKRAYLYAVGRRKEANAIVKLFKNGKGKILVNGKEYANYFPIVELQQTVDSPLRSVGQADKVDVEAKVWGGGARGQAEAVRLGISRTLVQLNVNFKKNLRKAGFLTRDPRAKERKKYGLRKARRAPQWQKR